MTKTDNKIINAQLKLIGVTDPPVDVERIAVENGIEVVNKILEDETSGFLLNSPDNDHVIICVNRSHHPNRQRFTIAHELGHFFLHSQHEPLFVDNAGYHFRDAVSSAGTHKTEREANAFAAALLMPQRFLERDIEEIEGSYIRDEDIAELASKYKVSEQAMTVRLVSLRYIQAE